MIDEGASVFLNALGAHERDSRLERALALVGGEYTVDEYDDAGVAEKYLILADRGVDFLLEDGEVETVFVYAAATQTRGVYAGWSALWEGLDHGSTRDDIARVLGEPLRSTSAYATYEADPGYVQFEFDGDTLTMAVFMRQIIGGVPAAEAPAQVASAEHIGGSITTFTRAVGQAMFSTDHMDVIALAGPGIETRDEMRDGVPWEYSHFPRTGVTLQFKDEMLVGALIRLLSDDGAATYPSPESLITGLPLPASRTAVGDLLGAPTRSSQYMDLFLIDERYLRFDYEDEQTTDVTVVLPGVELHG